VGQVHQGPVVAAKDVAGGVGGQVPPGHPVVESGFGKARGTVKDPEDGAVDPQNVFVHGAGSLVVNGLSLYGLCGAFAWSLHWMSRFGEKIKEANIQLKKASGGPAGGQTFEKFDKQVLKCRYAFRNDFI